MNAKNAANDDMALLIAAAEAAGDAVMPYFRVKDLAVTVKSDSTPVTLADKAGEAVMREIISAARSGDSIYGEEFGGASKRAAREWLIDPIDGTKSFMMGNPLFGNLIALMAQGVPILGAASMPALGELYYGDGKESFVISRKDGVKQSPQKISSMAKSSIVSLSQASLLATSPDMFRAAHFIQFEKLAKSCTWHRFGGDCYNYLLLASGFVDLVAEDGLAPYDILPLLPILEGAGCIVSDWQGEAVSFAHSSTILAAANPVLHRLAVSILSG